MTEFRVWKTARNAAEMRAAFDRSYTTNESHRTYLKAGEKYNNGARIAKTIQSRHPQHQIHPPLFDARRPA